MGEGVWLLWRRFPSCGGRCGGREPQGEARDASGAKRSGGLRPSWSVVALRFASRATGEGPHFWRTAGDDEEGDDDAHEALAGDEAGADGDDQLFGGLGALAAHGFGDGCAGEKNMKRSALLPGMTMAMPRPDGEGTYSFQVALGDDLFEHREGRAEEEADDDGDARGALEGADAAGEGLRDTGPHQA